MDEQIESACLAYAAEQHKEAGREFNLQEWVNSIRRWLERVPVGEIRRRIDAAVANAPVLS